MLESPSFPWQSRRLSSRRTSNTKSVTFFSQTSSSSHDPSLWCAFHRLSAPLFVQEKNPYCCISFQLLMVKKSLNWLTRTKKILWAILFFQTHVRADSTPRRSEYLDLTSTCVHYSMLHAQKGTLTTCWMPSTISAPPSKKRNKGYISALKRKCCAPQLGECENSGWAIIRSDK